MLWIAYLVLVPSKPVSFSLSLSVGSRKLIKVVYAMSFWFAKKQKTSRLQYRVPIKRNFLSVSQESLLEFSISSNLTPKLQDPQSHSYSPVNCNAFCAWFLFSLEPRLSFLWSNSILWSYSFIESYIETLQKVIWPSLPKVPIHPLLPKAWGR